MLENMKLGPLNFINVINFDTVEFSERRSEEVISFF